jgi:hypothetical protein
MSSPLIMVTFSQSAYEVTISLSGNSLPCMSKVIVGFKE